MYKVVTKLKRLKKDLKQLNITRFSDVYVIHSQTHQKLLETQQALHNNPDCLVLRA